MPNWLLPYVTLIMLVYSSFACIGTAALWAAASPRYCLLRTAAVFLLPAPLLLRPAYELYAVFALQSLIVIFGAAVYRHALAQNYSVRETADSNTPPNSSHIRFSLSTLLIVMAVIAVLLTAAIRLPKWENLAWRTVVISGTGAGAGTLAGAWLYVARRKWIVWPIAGILCLAVGTAVSKLDWFFESVLQMAGWPPRPFTPANFMGDPSNYDAYDIWTFIPLIIALTTAILIYLWRAVTVNEESLDDRRSSPRRTFARGAFAVLAIILSTLPLCVMIAILLPAPLSHLAIPSPNAHNDFQRAAKLASTIKINAFDVETASIDLLSPFAAQVEQVDQIVAAGLEKPCYVPMDFNVAKPSLSNEQTDGYYAIEWDLATKGRLAAAANRFDEAAQVYLRAVEFGFSACRGAMVWEGGLIRARAAFGTRGLYNIREKLSDDLLATCLDRLIRIDADDERMNVVLDRYRVWAERRNGWHGHLKYLLEVYTSDPGSGLSSDFWHCESFRDSYRRSHAVTRLMICELAILQFDRDHKRRPKTLDELVPAYLPAVPSDPYDPQQHPLRYRRQKGGYVLYSVDENGVDDLGRPAAPGEYRPDKVRDLRLDSAFSK
jgi:hypothetical protein